MSKFFIECPHCGSYAQAKTGFFARKKIDCSCGYVIDVRTDKLASTECSHCQNSVVYDQSKGDKATCPVCQKPIVASDRTNFHEFSCQQCGVRLKTSVGASEYTCPVCDCNNNVSERLLKEKIQHDGLASIIKYEGDNETLVWKHPIEDFNLGSQLIVHESQEAIFFRDGQALDLFGAGRYALETQQLPLIEKIYKLPTDTQGTFHSEVYYINLTTQMGIKWGTDSKVRLFDPFSGLHLEIGANGEFNIKVNDSRKLLLKLVGTTSGLTQNELIHGVNGKSMFRSLVMTQVKTYLAQIIKDQSINILEIDEHLMSLSSALRDKVNEYLASYGLEIVEFFINQIVTPNNDPNFAKMKAQYAAKYILVKEEEIKAAEARAALERKTIEAQTAAQLEIIKAQGSAEAYRLQAEAEAREMQMKGYTYTQETARQVGLEAMQNGIVSENGTGSGIGELAGLGVSLGAMGGIMGMTKEAMSPIFENSQNVGEAVVPKKDTWNCSCGESEISGNFCSNCGSKKLVISTWNCACGEKGIIGNFCSNCGNKKPESSTWDCECGQTGITGNFCSNCGKGK